MRMLAAALLWLLAACAAGPPPGAGGDSGRLVELERIAVPGLPDQRVTIWLPPGYDASQRRYGVVYMHDGHNLFDPAKASFGKVWAADKAMLAAAAQGIEPRIVVGIWAPGAARYRQYLPRDIYDRAPPPLKAAMDDMAGGPIVSDRYLAWIVDTLKPTIDRDYRTKPGAAHTAIAGSSMGGLMSCYAFVRRPDIFGQAACVSSHWPAIDPAKVGAATPWLMAEWARWMREGLGDPAGRRLWMDHGTATLDAHYAPWQQAVDKGVAAAGWREGRDYASRVYRGAAHEENAWAARLPDIFAFLLAAPQ